MAEKRTTFGASMQAVIQEFVKAEQSRVGAGHKAELVEERRAAGEPGAAGERAGGGERAVASRRRKKRSGARRSGRSCRSWAWRRSIWRTGR